MAADIKAKFGSSGQALTITLASLASSGTACRESTVIDNSSNLYLDALIQVKFKLANTTPANDKALYVFAYGTVDGGTTYSGLATGSDAAYTRDDPTTLRLVGVVPTPTQNISYCGGPWSVAAAFGGVLPAKWGIIIQNYTGAALTGTGSDHAVQYQGVYAQST